MISHPKFPFYCCSITAFLVGPFNGSVIIELGCGCTSFMGESVTPAKERDNILLRQDKLSGREQSLGNHRCSLATKGKKKKDILLLLQL